MSEENWSDEGIDRLMRAMESDLRKDPLEVEREAAARRQEQAKAERIAAALPGRLREQEWFLKRNVPDDLIDDRLARRREAQGIAEGPEPRLPAQVDRDRVEERLRFAKEQLADRFGSELVKRDVDKFALEVEWSRHVDGRDLEFRERVRYEAESKGKQLTGSELSHEEARINAHNMWSEGMRGPSYTEIDRYIALARENGAWPPPELHTGPGSKPRPHPHVYTYERFKQYCAAPAHRHADAGHAGNSSMVDDGVEQPGISIRRLQSRQPQSRIVTSASSGAAGRLTRRDVDEHNEAPLHRGHSVPIRRLHPRQQQQFRTETPARTGGEAQAASREATGQESHALRVPVRKGLGDRLMELVQPIPRKIADRISRMLSRDREYTTRPPAASMNAKPIGRRLEVVRSANDGPMLLRHPVAFQAEGSRVATSDTSPVVRARDTGTSARASLIVARAAEPRSVNSR
ncbi:hypothetical protein [Rhizobium sp. BT-226]|uniref:hypothetical protein n=1 Tax=Rhizobium sp. BT-226 TaxID=2986922 RepID=UPI0021F7CBEF|nr:hypothetical protein [Rhizobium sp. BT-226]MCW0021424.1 hypothetical protein [Rhizobium sp. BT-226]